MKYTLTVSDMTEKEYADVFYKLKGSRRSDEAPQLELPVETVETSTETVNEENADEETVGEEIDADGVPWDERIHASTKGKTKAGLWKRRRGLQDFEYNQIVNELKTGQSTEGVEAPVEAVEIPEVIAAPVQPAPVVANPQPTEPVTNRDFAGLMGVIASLHVSKAIDESYAPGVVAEINNAFGTEVTSISGISGNEQMIEFAWQCLERDRKVA